MNNFYSAWPIQTFFEREKEREKRRKSDREKERDGGMIICGCHIIFHIFLPTALILCPKGLVLLFNYNYRHNACPLTFKASKSPLSINFHFLWRSDDKFHVWSFCKAHEVKVLGLRQKPYFSLNRWKWYCWLHSFVRNSYVPQCKI